MSDTGPNRDNPADSQDAAIGHLRSARSEGRPWHVALVEAMAMWAVPQETYRGRRYNYFIAGEAFDWLLLAERLCLAVDGLVPDEEKERLLFEGRLPADLDETRFKDLLGVEKHRGYLNYFYGVTVEEALQLAVEEEVRKRDVSNGVHYERDYPEEAFQVIYRAPRSKLLDRFRQETGHPRRQTVSVREWGEFTYWLFRYRLKNSDKAKIASDTRKGLEQLQRMGGVTRVPAGDMPPAWTDAQPDDVFDSS